MKSLFTILLFILISNPGFSQDKTKKDSTQFDTVQYKLLKKVDINKPAITSVNRKSKASSYKIMYRPTRLGSSSPLYNTYKKNNYGAGAITTNPQKSGKSFIFETPTHYVDSLEATVKDSLPRKKD